MLIVIIKTKRLATENLHESIMKFLSKPASSPSKTDCSNPTISLLDFTEGDIMIFFPTPTKDYLAFNIETPRHYLSAESIAVIKSGSDKYFKPSYVLGRMIFRHQYIASVDQNPFKLPVGVAYYVVTVESISGCLSLLSSPDAKFKKEII